MITKQLENVIEKYNIKDTSSIIYGTNIPMPKDIRFKNDRVRINFEESKFYFFRFDNLGITVYSLDGSDTLNIPWSEVLSFKISHILILGKMTVKTNDMTYKFQLNRFVIGCPWIGPNTKYLEKNNYFYKK